MSNPPLPNIQDPTANLTINQEVQARDWESALPDMTRAELEQAASLLYRAMLSRDNYYKELIKKQWGL